MFHKAVIREDIIKFITKVRGKKGNDTPWFSTLSVYKHIEKIVK